MMFLSAVNVCASIRPLQAQLPLELRNGYNKSLSFLLKVQSPDGGSTGLAVCVDLRGYAVTGRSLGEHASLVGKTRSGSSVTLARVAEDSVSGVTLFEIAAPLPADLRAAKPSASGLAEGSDSVAVLPSGPVKVVVTKTNQISYVLAQKKAMPVDQLQLMSPAKDLEGGLVFDQHGDLEGLLQAGLPVKVSVQESVSALTIKSMFGPPELVVAFSPTTKYLSNVIADLLSPSHHVVHPMFGVEVLSVPEDRGALVVKVQAGSPANRCGLQTGDVITTLGGEAVHNAVDYLRALLDQKITQPTLVDINRQGRVLTLRAFLVDSPAAAQTTAAPVSGKSPSTAGTDSH